MPQLDLMIQSQGRPGVVAGTREVSDGSHTPFTLTFVRHAAMGDCIVYHCKYQR
jgi:hypothetical protein